jgi:heavy metal efflux system protein
METLSGV